MNNDKIKYYITSTNITDFKGLVYTNNSCYIDSILISLFSPENNGKILVDFFLKNFDLDDRKNICCDDLELSKRIRKLLQKELENIYYSINNLANVKIKNIEKLRKILNFCNYSENYGNNGMKDPAEFLSYLFELFNVLSLKYHKVYGVTPQSKMVLLDKNTNNKASPIITHILTKNVNLSSLISQNEVNNINFTRNSTNFVSTVTITQLIDCSFIVFHIQRTTLCSNFNTNKVIAEDIITVNNRAYKLSAVIVFNNNHYTSFFKKLNKWYYYDDTLLELVKHFDKYQIESKGVLYFYY
jgi:hypothetical protein